MSSINVKNNTFHKRWEFNGSALPTEWSLLQLGSGHTVSVTGGALTIATGTTASSETIIRCSTAVNLKFIARFLALLSQRIANQTFYFEVTNEAGTTYARWLLDGTTATTGKAEAANGGVANTAASVTIATTAAYGTFEIYGEIEQVLFSQSASNTNTVKGGVVVFDRNIPEPTENYYIQIRAQNGATPPASTTTLTVDAVLIEDLQTLAVEILRADGGGAASSAMPVRALGGTVDTVSTVSTAYVTNKSVRVAETTTNPAAGATITGTTRDTGTTATYVGYRLFVNSAQAGTLYVEQSSDATTWYVTDTVSVTAAVPLVYEAKLVLRYCRFRYVNGATAVASGFRIDSLQIGMN